MQKKDFRVLVEISLEFLYVDDLINAIISCFGNSHSIGKVINIGQGKPRKVKDIIKHICRKIGTVYLNMARSNFAKMN